MTILLENIAKDLTCLKTDNTIYAIISRVKNPRESNIDCAQKTVDEILDDHIQNETSEADIKILLSEAYPKECYKSLSKMGI